MGLWQAIIEQTSGSPIKLITFGVFTTTAMWVVGQAFVSATLPDEETIKKRMKERGNLPYDDERQIRGQTERLTTMLREVQEGGRAADAHWYAAMRGTVLPHPSAESRTQALDNLRSATLAARAAELEAEEKRKQRKWYSLW